MRERLISCDDASPTGPGGWDFISAPPPSGYFTHESSEPPRRSGPRGARVENDTPPPSGPIVVGGVLSPWNNAATWTMGSSKWFGVWFRCDDLPDTGSTIIINASAGGGAFNLQAAVSIGTDGTYYLTALSDGSVPQIGSGGTYVEGTWVYLQMEIRRGTGGADGYAKLFVDAKQESDGPTISLPPFDNDSQCSTTGTLIAGMATTDIMIAMLEQGKIGTTFNSTSMFQSEWGWHGARAG